MQLWINIGALDLFPRNAMSLNRKKLSINLLSPLKMFFFSALCFCEHTLQVIMYTVYALMVSRTSSSFILTHGPNYMALEGNLFRFILCSLRLQSCFWKLFPLALSSLKIVYSIWCIINYIWHVHTHNTCHKHKPTAYFKKRMQWPQRTLALYVTYFGPRANNLYFGQHVPNLYLGPRAPN